MTVSFMLGHSEAYYASHFSGKVGEEIDMALVLASFADAERIWGVINAVFAPIMNSPTEVVLPPMEEITRRVQAGLCSGEEECPVQDLHISM
jgi:hypothetical protein